VSAHQVEVELSPLLNVLCLKCPKQTIDLRLIGEAIQAEQSSSSPFVRAKLGIDFNRVVATDDY
jgi:hypothetical protein